MLSQGPGSWDQNSSSWWGRVCIWRVLRFPKSESTAAQPFSVGSGYKKTYDRKEATTILMSMALPGGDTICTSTQHGSAEMAWIHIVLDAADQNWFDKKDATRRDQSCETAKRFLSNSRLGISHAWSATHPAPSEQFTGSTPNLQGEPPPSTVDRQALSYKPAPQKIQKVDPSILDSSTPIWCRL